MKNLLTAGFLSILASSYAHSGVDPYYDDAVLAEQLAEEKMYQSKNGVEVDFVDLRRSAEQENLENQAMDAELKALEETKRQLKEAIALKDQAAKERDQMLAKHKAQEEASMKMRKAKDDLYAKQSQVNLAKQTIIPAKVMNEQISVTATNENVGTLKEITKMIMPSSWIVNESYKEGSKLHTQRFEFMTTDRRDSALRSLYSGVETDKVRFKYFWDLVDKDGYPAPVILITDHK
jgi:hypothetical protein